MNEAERILKLGQNKAEAEGKEISTYDSFFIDAKLSGQVEELVGILKNKDGNPVLTDLGKISDKHYITRSILWLHDLPPFGDIMV